MNIFADLLGPSLCAGVDEVGRGPLAGPVYAAAVIMPLSLIPEGLTDSKKLSRSRREILSQQICQNALAWSIGVASVREIDQLNILRASHLAMQRAVSGLGVEPQLVLVDGNMLPRFTLPALALVKGDSRIPAISAASVVAKVARDAEMTKLAALYPGYGFEQHKGYPTRAHLCALEELGPTPEHRRSFAPVRRLLDPADSATIPADG